MKESTKAMDSTLESEINKIVQEEDDDLEENDEGTSRYEFWQA